MNSKTTLRQYLGHCSNTLESAINENEEYVGTKISTIFDQSFNILDSQPRLVVDTTRDGFELRLVSHTIYISESLFNHSGISIRTTDPIETSEDAESIVDWDIFPTLVFLKHRFHFVIDIEQSIKEPIYINISSDYESLATSLLMIKLGHAVDAEIIEEIDNKSAIISCINYILMDNSNLRILTNYQNLISSSTYIYRLVASKESSNIHHSSLILGSTSIIDETKFVLSENTNVTVSGAGSTRSGNFRKLIYIVPLEDETLHTADISFSSIVTSGGECSVVPLMINAQPSPTSSVQITELDALDVDESNRLETYKEYLDDVIDNGHRLSTSSERLEDSIDNFYFSLGI